MTTSYDIVNSIHADITSAEIADNIMDSISKRVYERIEGRKTEVFAREMDSIATSEEEETE